MSTCMICTIARLMFLYLPTLGPFLQHVCLLDNVEIIEIVLTILALWAAVCKRAGERGRLPHTSRLGHVNKDAGGVAAVIAGPLLPLLRRRRQVVWPVDSAEKGYQTLDPRTRPSPLRNR